MYMIEAHTTQGYKTLYIEANNLTQAVERLHTTVSEILYIVTTTRLY